MGLNANCSQKTCRGLMAGETIVFIIFGYIKLVFYNFENSEACVGHSVVYVNGPYFTYVS
jgi:hypothetical protein